MTEMLATTHQKFMAFGLALILGLAAGFAGYLSAGNPAFAQDAGQIKELSVPPGFATGIAPRAPGSSVRPPASQKWGEPATLPENIAPQLSDPTVWGQIRHGARGQVSIPDKNSAVLVQTRGWKWRTFRTGPMASFGGWLLLAVVVVLAIFYFQRGRIRISAGWSGNTIMRFSTLERFAHWLTAVPFVILALTGLNLMYGRTLLIPLIGKDAFSVITVWGKILHNYTAFAFILGILLMIVIWLRYNIWDKYDAGWIQTGGGMFSDDVHPPARKFNTGQKVIFWAVILAGGSLSYSGIALLFPFEFAPFAPTFQLLNSIGFDLPATLEPIEEMQFMQAWHAILALLMTALIIAHIYIGTLGMEGAVSAMWSGEVDENWAREHHSAWVAELKGEPEPDPIVIKRDSQPEQPAHE